ncbi:MAG TPA: hypothetical protein VGD35_16165, partial [Chitinophaga sp.]
NWILFAFIAASYVLLSLYFNEYILTDNIFYNSFGEQLAIERIEQIINMQKRWRWLGYAFAPAILALRILAVCGCIYLRLFFDNKDMSFKALMKIVLVAEFVFLLELLVRTFYLSFFAEVNTLTDLQSFSLLSLSGLFPQAGIPAYLKYPLQTASVFQVAYIIMLAEGVRHFSKVPFMKALLIALSSYGIGLICWIVFVMFLILQYGS